MLKLKYGSKSEIPKGLETYYTEKDGEFVLQVDGIKTDEDVQAVQTALENERKLKREAETKYKDLEKKYSNVPDDFDLDEFNRLKDTNSTGAIDEKLKLQRESLTAQHKKEKEVLQKERDEAISKNEGFLKNSKIDRLIAENKIHPDYADGVRAILEKQIKLEGENVLLGEQPFDEGAKAWLESSGKAYVAASQNKGGGAESKANEKGATGKTITREEFNAKAHADRSAFFKEGGKVVDA